MWEKKYPTKLETTTARTLTCSLNPLKVLLIFKKKWGGHPVESDYKRNTVNKYFLGTPCEHNPGAQSYEAQKAGLALSFEEHRNPF
jgi:hypothetical protein